MGVQTENPPGWLTLCSVASEPEGPNVERPPAEVAGAGGPPWDMGHDHPSRQSHTQGREVWVPSGDLSEELRAASWFGRAAAG